MNQKLDIHNIAHRYDVLLEKFNSDNSVLKKNKKVILDFVRDGELGKTVKGKAKKKLGRAVLYNYICIMRSLSFWFNKPFTEMTQKDMEEFILRLEHDKITPTNPGIKKYSDSYKVCIKKAIIKLYKYLAEKYKDNRHLSLVDWIDTSCKLKEYDALTRKEIEKIAETCSLKHKVLIMFLFDSGCRIEEALNVRKNCLEKEYVSGDIVYKVRIQFSKTKPRTIRIPICSELISKWIELNKEMKENDFLFDMKYNAIRKMLARKSQTVLEKHLTPHMLRHSSATYYCNRMNTHQLAYRYGWTISSNMPNRYIDRNGIIEEETAKTIKNEELINVRKEKRILKEAFINLKSQLDRINTFMRQIIKDGKFVIMERN